MKCKYCKEEVVYLSPDGKEGVCDDYVCKQCLLEEKYGLTVYSHKRCASCGSRLDPDYILLKSRTNNDACDELGFCCEDCALQYFDYKPVDDSKVCF